MNRAIRVSVLSIVVAAALVACGGSSTSLKHHAFAAQTLEKFAQEATLIAHKQLRDEAEARLVGVEGQAAREAIGREVEVWFKPRQAALNLFINAKIAWVDAAWFVLQEDKPRWSDLKPDLRAVLAAYDALGVILGPGKLPKIPPIIYEIVKE